MERGNLDYLIKQYDKAILYHLRVMEEAMDEEYKFIQKWKTANV